MIIIYVTIDFFLFIVTAMGVLPSILSSNNIKRWIIQTVNNRVSGHLQVKDWSIRWYGGIYATGLTYENHLQGFVVRANEINGSKGLFRLLVDRNHLGSIHIKSPRVYFYMASGARASVSGENGLSEKNIQPISPEISPIKNTPNIKKPKEKPENETKSSKWIFPEIDGRFAITDGTVYSVFPQQAGDTSNRASLDAESFSFTTTGKISTQGKEHVLAANGVMNLDLKALSKPLLNGGVIRSMVEDLIGQTGKKLL